ncbi:putative endonuclease [Orenia metallireducens]|jgi:putative endonuclease|uniref:Putative endonuclease n=1 Tax=Orenia metallireducens TaxID=1413210 RepID=A0A285GZG3_9FIRM|nr:GIY-YIG nuclease family protein [Orenia metallireducens]PRX26448.1 putative endonuclease [Orenia metallireducens]SNY28694.1 putative endonuclease [Orenia metallireducens]
MSNYVYILQCADNTLYTGYTNDLERRINLHNSGKGAKYTRGRTPVKLRYFEEYQTKSEAMKREYAIKQLKRQDKLRLIKGDIDG